MKAAIVAGVTTNACVVIAASDLYIRDFHLFVPSDCVAALTDSEQRGALELMKMNFGADIRESEQLELDKLLG